MKIEVFGTGCARCEMLAANAKAAADQLGIDYDLEKISDLAQMVSRGVIMTPALAVDGEVKLAGKLADVDAIVAMLRK